MSRCEECGAIGTIEMQGDRDGWRSVCGVCGHTRVFVRWIYRLHDV